MATIDIEFNKLKKELNKPDLTIEELEEILFDFGLEIDDYQKEEDNLKIEVTAERVDLLSFHGLIRSLKVYLGIEKYEFSSYEKSDLEVNISQSAIDYGSKSLSFIVKNIDLNDSKIKEIINVQEKLHSTYGRKRKSIAIGIYPLDEIKFPISFLAEDKDKIKFVPLGEDKEMSAKEIIENHPTGIEYSSLVKDKKRLTIFKDSENKILSMPPIINSQETGRVNSQTKNLFVECSGENLEKLKHIISILSEMFKDIGGEIQTVNVNFPDLKIESPINQLETKKVSLNYLNKIIGIKVDSKKAKDLLEKMLYKVEIISEDELKVSYPLFRADILHENDIADDLARSYKFSNIELKTPKVFNIAQREEISIHQDNIIQIMTQLGFQEVMPLTLSSEKESFDNFLIEKKDFLSLGFSAERNLNIITNWYYPKLIKILSKNLHKSFPQKIFVCDYLVKKDETQDTLSKNILKTSAVISNSKVSFTEISSYLYGFLKAFGKDLKLEKHDLPFYLKGRSAKVFVDNKEIGHIGEFNPEVLLNNNYTMPVCGFEIEF